jgi:hypothetical protein
MAYNFQASAVFSGTDQMSAAVKKMQTNTTAAAGKMGKGLDNTAKRADALKSAIGGVGKIAAGVALGSLIAKGITAATTQIKNLVSSIQEYSDRVDGIRTSALKTGLNVQEFQKLSWAAESNNVSVEKLQTGLTALNKSLGAGTLMKHLSEVNTGLAAQVKKAKTNTEVFNLLSDAIKSEGNIAKKSALLNAAFGKSGNELIPLLNQGAEAIRQAGENISHIISDREIAAAKLWNSTLGDVKKNIQGFGDVIRNHVINAAGPYLMILRDWINKNREFLKQRIAEAVQKAVIFIKQAVIEVQKAIKFFQQWGKTLLALGGAVVTIIAIAKAINGIKIVIDGARAAMILFSGASAAAGVSAAGAGTSAVAGATAFKGLAASIGASNLAMTGLIGLAIAGAAAAWKVVEWGNKKLQKIDPAVPGMGNYYNLHYGARRKAWEKYEAEHPDEPTYAQRVEAAKNPAKEAEDPMKELFEKMFGEMEEANAKYEKMLVEMEETNKKMDEQTGAITGLAEEKSNPMRVRWENMGLDYWETARLGV